MTLSSNLLSLTILSLTTLLLLIGSSYADLPVDCRFQSVLGKWRFTVTDKDYDNTITQKCTLRTPLKDISSSLNVMEVTFKGPNIAEQVSPKHVIGDFTFVYNQGFQIQLNGDTYFAYFNYTQNGDQVTSYCDETMTGWLHVNEEKSNKWGCFRAEKIAEPDGSLVRHHLHKNTQRNEVLASSSVADNALYQTPHKLIETVNSEQSSWVAAPNAEVWNSKTVAEARRHRGIPIPAARAESVRQHMQWMKQYRKSSANGAHIVNSLPDNFTWRNFHNQSFVPDIRSQGSCGSCYSFATTGAAMARARVQTQNQKQPQFSPQDVMSCGGVGSTLDTSVWNQQCEGGFSFLVLHYAQQYGFNSEKCFPYKADASIPCSAAKCQDRTFVKNYGYIGGYYGASTMELMMEELFHNGPIPVNILVHPDFMHYKSGVYHHVESTKGLSPFELTNHLVFITGYGVDEHTNELWWEIQNSWSTSWGMDGYGLIRRGTDEIAIESMTTHFDFDY